MHIWFVYRGCVSLFKDIRQQVSVDVSRPLSSCHDCVCVLCVPEWRSACLSVGLAPFVCLGFRSGLRVSDGRFVNARCFGLVGFFSYFLKQFQQLHGSWCASMSFCNVPPPAQVRATGDGASNGPRVTVLADEDERSSQRRKCLHCRETGHNKRTCPQLANKDVSDEACTAGTGRAVGGNSSCWTEAGRRPRNGQTRSREHMAMTRRHSIQQQWTVLPPPPDVELIHYKDFKA